MMSTSTWLGNSLADGGAIAAFSIHKGDEEIE
jgi:hypothetical protein